MTTPDGRAIAAGPLAVLVKGALVALVLCFACSTAVLAVPGQTEAQLAEWGKHVAALRGFEPTIDDCTGGTDYIADVLIDGHPGSYSAEAAGGVVHQESVDFKNIDDVTKNVPLIADTANAIYGAAYARDFHSATHVPYVGRVAVWKGERLAYFAFGGAVFFARNADFAALMKNVRECDALDCSGD